MNNFIFDVDGTLTPSRGKIDLEFGKWFLEFCNNNPVYLVTGSDKPKTVEQVGEQIYNAAIRVYNCSGNDTYRGITNIFQSTWTLPKEAREFLTQHLKESKFPLRTGTHIEERTGMVNYSVVGRGATIGERKLYVEWDTDHNERNDIAKEFKKQFPGIDAVVGGDTGIDIYPIGNDKSQILRDFDIENDFIYFFGDKMDYGGNDWPLKMKFVTEKWSGNTIAVEDWQDTFSRLKDIERNHH
tara:strand:+ start:514 stop:1236 length:723 start_codon:yes stop_codon:yes gene_type:complete